MEEAFKTLKNRKAPGPKGFNLDLFKYGGISLEYSHYL
jgi:hypothetical protein